MRIYNLYSSRFRLYSKSKSHTCMYVASECLQCERWKGCMILELDRCQYKWRSIVLFKTGKHSDQVCSISPCRGRIASCRSKRSYDTLPCNLTRSRVKKIEGRKSLYWSPWQVSLLFSYSEFFRKRLAYGGDSSTNPDKIWSILPEPGTSLPLIVP